VSAIGAAGLADKANPSVTRAGRFNGDNREDSAGVQVLEPVGGRQGARYRVRADADKENAAPGEARRVDGFPATRGFDFGAFGHKVRPWRKRVAGAVICCRGAALEFNAAR
jgi:hypothetical protein